MNNYIEEVDNNFDNFFEEVKISSINAFDSLSVNKEDFKESYRRLTSFQAWNSELLKDVACADTKGFFLEAQNDALMSHALARQGAWRVALMSLRSCIENTLFGLYYINHPVELKLWKVGSHKLGFSEVKNYLMKHPDFSGLPDKVTGISELEKEYATLSKAVHGSSSSFRVTRDGHVEGLNVLSDADLGSWKCREKKTVKLLNIVLLNFFKEDLAGTSLPNLRKSISLAIPHTLFFDIKKELNVKLRTT